ncbi:MAG: hypothetical protein LC808_41550 [Actinobacteria bacterium]|nr:hypothetical protein [Actinomycetota bacterium]
MGVRGPRELSKLFEQYFAEGALDQLMTLYEDDAMFPTTRSTASGEDEIRSVLKGYIDSGANLHLGIRELLEIKDNGACPCGHTRAVVDRAPSRGRRRDEGAAPALRGRVREARR